jgi:hypothetical protein
VSGHGGKPVTFFVELNDRDVSRVPQGLPEDPEHDTSILDLFRAGNDQSEGHAFSFDDVTSSVTALAGAMTRALQAIAPDEGEIEFGIDIGVESGQLTSLLVKGSGNATLKVRLLWKNDSATTAGPA